MDTVRLLLLNKGLVMESYITFESEIDKILKSLEGDATSNLNAQNSGQIVDAVNGLTANVAGAFVDDQNEADLMNELRRQLQQDMISSLFPPGFIEKCMVRAKLELAKKNPSDENM